MRQIRQVLRLAHETDLSQRAIARSLRISRDSVSDYLMRAAALKVSWPLPEEMDDATLEAKLFPSAAAQLMRKPDPDWASVHAQLKGKGATLKALHEEYAQDNPQALKLSQFCHRFRTWQKSLKRYLRQTHVAGERVFVDYAGPTMEIVDVAAGTVRTAQIFVGVLGGSSYTYAEAHWSQKLHDVQIHTEADLPPDSADPVEPDPAEELPASAPKRSSRPPSLPAKADAGRDERSKEQEGSSRQSNKAEQGSGPTEEDRDLFGDEIFELIAERKPVKLDPTIGDRKRLSIRSRPFNLRRARHQGQTRRRAAPSKAQWARDALARSGSSEWPTGQCQGHECRCPIEGERRENNFHSW